MLTCASFQPSSHKVPHMDELSDRPRRQAQDAQFQSMAGNGQRLVGQKSQGFPEVLSREQSQFDRVMGLARALELLGDRAFSEGREAADAAGNRTRARSPSAPPTCSACTWWPTPSRRWTSAGTAPS